MGKEEVRGALAVIRFDGQRCIHSRHCVLDRPDVFVPNIAGEWIHPDNARPEEILELAHNCPSGAITCERLDGGPQEAPPINLIAVREAGPYAVRGALSVAGNTSSFRATLCRCGQSQHKPYCDGAHNAARFAATGEPDTDASEPLAARNGPVTVTPAEDGPLLVSGNLEVVTGTGRTIDRCTKTAFCRCGHSHTKPFCDGTHKMVGFTAPGS